MSVKIENGKCKLGELTDLRIKRYLSQTRSYIREGAWIREFFKEVFPAAGVEDSGELYFDLNSLEPHCDTDVIYDLRKTKITPESLATFERSIDSYRERLQAGRLSFNEELSSSEFSLPDPREHPETYLVSRDESGGVRLIILWGLESTKSGVDHPIDEIYEILAEGFIGKTAPLKAIKGKPSKGHKLDPKSEKNLPNATPSKTPDPQPSPSKPTKVVATTPPEAVEKAEPKPSKTKAVSKPKKENQKFNWSKLKWLRNTFVCTLLIGIIYIGAAYAATEYLGDAVEVNPIQQETTSRIIPVAADEELVLPNRQIITSDKKDAFLIPPFKKAGNYRFIRRKKGATEGKEIFIKYANSRNDMLDLPIASLGIEKRILKPGESLIANVGQSFHESSEEIKLQHAIDWGDSQSGFTPVPDPNAQLSHVYNKSGSYRISLLVKDDRGNWDYDFETVIISDTSIPYSEAQNLPPVADAVVTDIVQNEKGFLVSLKLNGSYDLDGELETISIDWGENNQTELQGNAEKASHQFPKRSNRCTIRVTATDNLGLASTKSALLEIDFRSPLLNDPQRFLSEKSDLTLNKSIISDESGMLIVSKSVARKPIKNKKYQRFALQTPKSNSAIIFKAIKWSVQSHGIATQNLKDVSELEILTEDGVYVLKVSAADTDGNLYELTHRFTVRIQKNLPLHIKMATWLAQSLSSIISTYKA